MAVLIRPNIGIGVGMEYWSILSQFHSFGWSPLAVSPSAWFRPESLVNPNLQIYSDQVNNAAWTKSGGLTVTADQDGVADEVEDANAGGIGYYHDSFTVPDNSVPYTFQLKVEKTASTHVAKFKAQITGGSAVSEDSKINLNTGATLSGSAVATSVDANYWLITWTVTNNGTGNTTLYWEMVPVYNKDGSTSQDNSALGTLLVKNHQFEVATAATSYVANGATAGGIVALWPDSSGNGNDATQGTQASMPVVVADKLDGFSGVFFEGVDDFLTLDSLITMPGPFELWAVLEKETYTLNNVAIVGGPDVSNRGLLVNTAQTVNMEAGGDSDSVTLGGSNPLGTDPILLRIQRDASDNLTAEFNGVDVTFSTPNNVNDFLFRYLGAYNAGISEVEVILHEVVLVPSALVADDRTNMLGHFAGRYPTLGI